MPSRPPPRAPNASSVMRTGSLASCRPGRSSASSAIPRRGSSCSPGAQKNSLRRLWPDGPGLVRPQVSPRPGPALRGASDLSRGRAAPGPLPAVRRGEARAAGLAGRQPALPPALRALRRHAVSERLGEGGGGRSPSRLARGQGDGQAVHAGAARMTTFRRVATRAAMYNTARTVARPPCTKRRPRRVPESRLSGATPTSFAISRRESRPSSGRSPRSVRASTGPTPGTLRRRSSASCQRGLWRIA